MDMGIHSCMYYKRTALAPLPSASCVNACGAVETVSNAGTVFDQWLNDVRYGLGVHYHGTLAKTDKSKPGSKLYPKAKNDPETFARMFKEQFERLLKKSDFKV